MNLNIKNDEAHEMAMEFASNTANSPFFFWPKKKNFFVVYFVKFSYC